MVRLSSAVGDCGARTTLRRALVGSCAVTALTLSVPAMGGAVTHPRIRPHQYFAGSINGSLGRPKHAVIRVVCPGPSSIGQTGHPLAGQPIAVGRVLPTALIAGYTGNTGTSISVFFGVPPPTPVAIGTLTFTRYGVSQNIPTSLSLPCAGTGVVTFYPFPRDPPISRAEVVPVEYVNLAVAPASSVGV
jgi:hypothetical protein